MAVRMNDVIVYSSSKSKKRNCIFTAEDAEKQRKRLQSKELDFCSYELLCVPPRLRDLCGETVVP